MSRFISEKFIRDVIKKSSVIRCTQGYIFYQLAAFQSSYEVVRKQQQKLVAMMTFKMAVVMKLMPAEHVFEIPRPADMIENELMTCVWTDFDFGLPQL